VSARLAATAREKERERGVSDRVRDVPREETLSGLLQVENKVLMAMGGGSGGGVDLIVVVVVVVVVFAL
jgi:hypothetical protein